MSTLSWYNLRALAGSQHNAFEELCCQLAAHEPAPAGAEYRRIGAPDAGVECIWRDPDGSVRGWQAKFFLHPPSAGEWKQLDESVHQAIDHYPELRRYTVCLPTDRPDARLPRQKSMMARWDDRVARWMQYAADRGRHVVFGYWGEHEITDRLARAEHAGRRYYFFNQHSLGPRWFQERFETARISVGGRYTPRLNIELEISGTFDALTRHARFTTNVRRQWGVVRRELGRVIPTNPALQRSVGTVPSQFPGVDADARVAAWNAVAPALAIMERATDAARAAVAALTVDVPAPLPFGSLEEALRILRDAVGALETAMEAGDTAARAVRIAAASVAPSHAAGPPLGPGPTATNRAPVATDLGGHRLAFEYERHHAWQAQRELYRLIGMCNGVNATVANTPSLLVTGDAGTGKTHLFCDVAERGLAEGRPCVLVLGEQIVRGDPWPQLMQQLQLDCRTPDEFLGALSAAAEATGCRALILLDALNEGEGRDVWPHHLSAFLATVARHPWVAVAVSVRSSYTDTVVSKPARHLLTEIVHTGFAEREADATRRFFDAFGLERPSVPLLAPEFANPLFLKLFCQGLKNRGLKRVPLGLEGISAVFDFFLSSVQDRLWHTLDIDKHDAVVDRAVSALAAEMRDCRTQWVRRDRAREIMDAVLPSHSVWQRSLLRHLIGEGVLSEEMVWVGPEAETVPVIRFTYERLGDHRIATLLLDEYLVGVSADTAHAVSAKRRGRRAKETAGPGTTTPSGMATSPSRRRDSAPLDIVQLMTDGRESLYYQGIVNALAIQAPERTGKEVWQLVPPTRPPAKRATGPNASSTVLQAVTEAFFASLEWRRPEAIGATALGIIDRHIREATAIGTRVRDLVVGVAARPGHPLNAQYLDRTLAPVAMPERDVWWSTYLASQSEISTPMGRLIDWAWRTGRESQHADETVLLAAIALAWALTTSQRDVRDHATKGLVSLLHSRPHILRRLLQRFEAVNDPYVSERLYAVAYGCVLRGVPRADLGALARFVMSRVFSNGDPPPHILLRDYALGIIERAVAEGLLTATEASCARPPYRSDPPGPAPSDEELRARYYTPFDAGKGDNYFSLRHSLGSMGDFARYIVGTNSNSFDWSARPLYGPHPATKRERHDAFVDALSPALRERWRSLSLAAFELELPELRPMVLESGKPALRVVLKHRKARAAREWHGFRAALPRELRTEFDDVRHWGNEPREVESFDLEYALRWLFQRVIELGWTPARFGEFDSRRDYDGRMSHRAERIGKKYQWMAWHEFVARVADNFAMRKEPWEDSPQAYHGPWQLFRRDIDPSYLGRGGSGFGAAAHSAWWQQVVYPDGDWRQIVNDAEWVAAASDLPRLERIINAVDPTDKTSWCWLRGDAEWREPAPPDEDAFERPRRLIRYWITALIVGSKQREQLLRWARGRDLWNVRLHDVLSTTDVFLGEYPWAPAFWTQYESTFLRPWTRMQQLVPVPVLRPAVTYHWESNGYDRSIRETVSLSVPSPAMLGYPGVGSVQSWPCAQASALYRNPSVTIDGPDALLARAVEFRTLLDRRQRDVVWFMTGEKLLTGDSFRNGEEWTGRLELSAVGCFVDRKWHEWHAAHLNRGSGARQRVTW